MILEGVGETLPQTITQGGYLEIEFSNTAEFSELYYPLKNAVNVQDNIWRLYFQTDMDDVLFKAMLQYAG